ncbi:MAG: response regulator transcription factor [Gammaproteobacteria bacterium]|nr:response regulator transcription factor [Gammaproteobacteria bacterium]
MRHALIVDADPIARNRLLNALVSLRPSLIVCAEATLAAARKRIKQRMPELLITDFYLSDGSGLQLLEQVRGLDPKAPRLIFSDNSDEDHVMQAFKIGVDGFLLKKESEQNLRQLLRSTLRSEPALSAEIARLMISLLKLNQTQSPLQSSATVHLKDRQESGLTEREVEVLALLARGMDRHQVAEALAIRASTVAGHVKSIYLKLNVRTRAEATLAAVNMGLVHPVTGEPSPASMLP